jgi:putative tryptophan/tyrosine transport system substrate-binding protein
MNRRRLLFAGASYLACSRVSWARTGPARVGALIGTANDSEGQERLAAFKSALAEKGWREPDNVIIDVQWLSTDKDEARRQAVEIVRTSDAILAANTISVDLLKLIETKKPIVFVSVFDPVFSGFVRSFDRPGGNITGFTNHVPTMGQKWIEYLKDCVPGTSAVALLFNPATAPMTPGFYETIFAKGGQKIGVETMLLPVASEDEVRSAMKQLSDRSASFAAMADPFTTNKRKLLVDSASSFRVPAIYPWTFFTRMGGLMSYGVDIVDIFRRSAAYVDLVLKGANPAELPVQAPERLEFAVNPKTAAALGITIPVGLLGRADIVIE